MRDYRRLPPVLKVASVLGLLFPLGLMAAFMTVPITRLLPSTQSAMDVSRVGVMAVNLALIGMACTNAVQVYSTRVRQPGRRPFAVNAWQNQLRMIMLPSAPPVCALVLAMVISPTADAFQIVFPTSIIGAVVCLAVILDMRDGREATD